MYSTPQRTIDKGLAKFRLIDDGGDGKTTACAMTMLGWLAGHKRWTDKPVCAHETLADIVINGNDESGGRTKAAEKKRAYLVKLGYEGVLDTWWIPEEVIEWLTDREQKAAQAYAYAVAVLKATAKWKKKRFKVARFPTEYAANHKLHVLNVSVRYPGSVWVKVF